jgi:hypothetical protein
MEGQHEWLPLKGRPERTSDASMTSVPTSETGVSGRRGATAPRPLTWPLRPPRGGGRSRERCPRPNSLRSAQTARPTPVSDPNARASHPAPIARTPAKALPPRSRDPRPEIRQIPRSHTCRFPYGNLPVAGSAAVPKGRASASKATDEDSFGRSAGAQADSRRGRTRNAQREAYDCRRRGHNAVGRANGREGGRANGRVSNVTSTFAVTRIDCHWGGVSFDRHPHRVGGDDRP